MARRAQGKVVELQTPEPSSKTDLTPGTPPAGGPPGPCIDCLQTHAEGEEHLKLELGDDVILNGVWYKAGSRVLYPASAGLPAKAKVISKE